MNPELRWSDYLRAGSHHINAIGPVLHHPHPDQPQRATIVFAADPVLIGMGKLHLNRVGVPYRQALPVMLVIEQGREGRAEAMSAFPRSPLTFAE